MNEKQFYALYHKKMRIPDHPYCTKDGKVYAHRLKVEKVIGRYLTPKEQIHHHYNADGSATLVLCPNKTYHSLLHIREKALRMCGNANWRKCVFCKQYDDPKNLTISTGIYHKECANKYNEKG